MSHERILIVEDDEDIVELIRYNLVKDGFRPKSVTTGEDAIQSLSEDSYDLVLLDLMLPGENGVEICRRIREFSDVPIIMLTAKVKEIEKLKGFEVGIDDYLTKPFSSKELLARIRAVIKRYQGQR